MNTATTCRPDIAIEGQIYGDYPSEAWDSVPATPAEPSKPLYIEARIYEALAQELIEKIAHRDYITTTVEVEVDGGKRFFRLTLGAIISRYTDCRPDGTSRPIADVVPIWWELHSFRGEEEVINDATFERIKEHLLNQ